MKNFLKLFTALLFLLYCFNSPPVYALDGDHEQSNLSEKQGLPDCAQVSTEQSFLDAHSPDAEMQETLYVETTTPQPVYFRKEYVPYSQVTQSALINNAITKAKRRIALKL